VTTKILWEEVRGSEREEKNVIKKLPVLLSSTNKHVLNIMATEHRRAEQVLPVGLMTVGGKGCVERV
jgi:hypothetical protein